MESFRNNRRNLLRLTWRTNSATMGTGSRFTEGVCEGRDCGRVGDVEQEVFYWLNLHLKNIFVVPPRPNVVTFTNVFLLRRFLIFFFCGIPNYFRNHLCDSLIKYDFFFLGDFSKLQFENKVFPRWQNSVIGNRSYAKKIYWGNLCFFSYPKGTLAKLPKNHVRTIWKKIV